MTKNPEPRDEVTLSVVVERSGGFAGLTRRWRVEAAPGEAPDWVELVDQCPWDEPGRTLPSGADRFAWTVSAHRGRERRHAELAEQDVDGAWKRLIDAVRDAADTARRSASAPPEE